MSPRTNRWLLGFAILFVFFLGACPMQAAATSRPYEVGGTGGGGSDLSKILDPPQHGGAGDRDGGDPDEVVIFIVSPGNPVVVPNGANQTQTTQSPAKLPSLVIDFRSLLFWAGVTR